MGINRERIGEWEEYIPDVEGQRELFLDEPDEALTVEVRHLSRDDLKQYIRIAERAKKKGVISSADQKMAAQIFEENVRNVKNMVLSDEPVLTGKDLYDSDEMELINDITGALCARGRLDEGLAKKSRRRSAFPSSGRQKKSDGDAPDVTRQSTQKTRETQTPPMASSVSTTAPNARLETVTESQTKDCSSSGIPSSGGARIAS